MNASGRDRDIGPRRSPRAHGDGLLRRPSRCTAVGVAGDRAAVVVSTAVGEVRGGRTPRLPAGGVYAGRYLVDAVHGVGPLRKAPTP